MPHRILVVDDAPAVRRVHERVLHQSGLTVLTAENGCKALAAARGVALDAVVTDVDMPVMDGLELCRHLRADATTRDVVVVIVTGNPSAAGRAALEAGCDAVLGKPCPGNLLLATVRQLLARRDSITGVQGHDKEPLPPDFCAE